MSLLRNFSVAAGLGLAVAAGFWGEDLVVAFKDMTKMGAPEFVSKADSDCKSLWVGTARNDPGLICYMQTRVTRLCDPQEKQHFVGVVDRYRASLAAYNDQLMRYLVRTKINMANSGGEKDTLVAYNEAMEQAAKDTVTEDLKKAIKLETVLDEDLSLMLRGLAEQGLIGPQDFGWRAPDFVNEAFVDLVVKNDSCPQKIEAK
jgi:hypothetical protein